MREYRIGRLNGRFVVTWPDPSTGKRRRYRLDALTPKEAEAEALDRIRKETLPTGPLTVADLWKAYRQHLADRPTGETMGYTGKAVLEHFGHLRPDQISEETCRAYERARKKAGIKTGSVWTELGHLRSCLRWAAEKARIIAFAPHIYRPQKPAPKDRWLTHAEIDRLLAADCEPHIKLAILLMLTTAGRVAAILELTWIRVDLGRGQINLRADQIGPRKGRAVVPINSTLQAALTTAKEAALSEYVIEWAGKPVRSIRNGFERAVANAGLTDVSCHTLRHTAAVHMVQAGVPMEEVAQYLGHSNPQITYSTYARFSPSHLRKAASALEFGRPRAVIPPATFSASCAAKNTHPAR